MRVRRAANASHAGVKQADWNRADLVIVRGQNTVLMIFGIACAAGAFFALAGDREDDDEDEDDARVNYWRPRVVVVGNGSVTSPFAPLACTAAGGACGPILIAFDERHPPLLAAIAARGWRFDHWHSSLRDATQLDGPYYMNGLGYEDTGETEIVTAVFVPTFPRPIDDNSSRNGH